MNNENEDQTETVDQTESEESTGITGSGDEKAQVVAFLKENGSPKLLERMSTKEGEDFCVSYILKNVADSGESVSVCAGWLEQALD